jgi:heme A synthase
MDWAESVIQQRAPGKSSLLAFRVVALAALVAAFGQVTLGGVVRVTGSGLGCPDWPLCHGRIVPPLDVATLIEYSHRLSASALGVLLLATTLMAWRYYRSNRWVFGGGILGLSLVVVAAVLGGATVLTELAWWVRLFHLGIAEVLVGCMVVVTVAGWRNAIPSPLAGEGNPLPPGGRGESPLSNEINEGSQANSSARGGEYKDTGRFNLLVVAALVGVFFLILSGSYMVGYGAGSSCATWPLCRGSLFPDGTAYAVHMGHRYIAALAGVLALAAAVSAWRRRAQNAALGWAGAVLALVFIAQVLAGAAMVWAGFAAQLKAIHLSMATLVWVAMVFLAALVYSPRRAEIGEVETAPRRLSELKGLTP